MMFELDDVPLWAAIAGSAFMLLGSALTLIGAFGLVRMERFYDRLHAPTLATSWGAGGLVMGSMIIFTAALGRPVLHEILIGVFVTVTTPITLMMLGRAALYRDRSERNPGVPPRIGHSAWQDTDDEAPKGDAT
jgi:multicomponent K+:H+ antiporter subunit G